MGVLHIDTNRDIQHPPHFIIPAITHQPICIFTSVALSLKTRLLSFHVSHTEKANSHRLGPQSIAHSTMQLVPDVNKYYLFLWKAF